MPWARTPIASVVWALAWLGSDKNRAKDTEAHGKDTEAMRDTTGVETMSMSLRVSALLCVL